jgi:hypothetical protein
MAPIFTGSKFGFGRSAVSGPTFFATTATGGTIVDSGDYRIHIFTSPGSFSVSQVGTIDTVEYLVVAGGGGGGNDDGGGGGAGGLRTNTPGITNALGSPLTNPPFTITNTSYSVTVGNGGPGPYNNGQSSNFGPISASGGGYGGNDLQSASTGNAYGNPGGSGGGGCGGDVNGQGATGNSGGYSPPEGNNGAPRAPSFQGGGGGGAGANAPGASGGNGVAIPWMPASYGTSGPTPGRWFAGGGGGGRFGAPGGAGGGGAGNNGGPGGPGPGTPGVVNTGGGGGGSGDLGGGGGAGGSGIVAVRYRLVPL